MPNTSHPQGKPVRPWKLLSSSVALDEKWFPVRKDRVELPSGKIIDDYFIWESPHIVAVVAITPEGKIVVVRQYRHAIGEIKHQLPAGAADKGETLEEAAQRELEEESGYITSKPLIHLGSFSQYPTKLSGREDIYLALDVTHSGHQHYDEQEESEVILMTKDEVWQLLETDQTHILGFTAGFLYALRYLETHPQ
jgi:NADH pyrophosphatase NudC (nudix superfamily)